MAKKRKKITPTRIDQISNNVSEEYVDLGKTNFATKEELCEVILDRNRDIDELLGRISSLKSKILGIYMEDQIPSLATIMRPRK